MLQPRKIIHNFIAISYTYAHLECLTGEIFYILVYCLNGRDYNAPTENAEMAWPSGRGFNEDEREKLEIEV
jgi:hypothetical protein